METKINIAEILKDKPKGTKLYSPLFGNVYLLGVDNNIIRIKYHEETVIFFGDGRYYNYPESEPLLFPSKEMHDWSKFATEEETQQLFDALAKEGKAWDAEKKQIIDLKPKIELKPFDKVLVRDSKSDYWRATLFSHVNENGCYYCVWAS